MPRAKVTARLFLDELPCVTCTRCGHTVFLIGAVNEDSLAQALAELRRECPLSLSNWYVLDKSKEDV